MGSATEGGAIKIAARVQDQPTRRSTSIAAIGKVMEVGIHPTAAGRRQLEDIAVPVGTAELRRPIKITGGIDRQLVDQAPLCSDEAVDHTECPSAIGGCQLINCATTT